MKEEEIEKELKRQLSLLEFGTTEITPFDEFKEMLRNSIKMQKPLRVKLGIDPTHVDIHIGHMVPFRKMRQFQDLGHQGVVIIGDYTARIGDPTGKNESRPPLSAEDTEANAKEYMQQVFTVLDENKTEIRYQTEWFNDVDLGPVLSWAGQTTVAKLLGHDTFRKRLDEGGSLGLHELLYPVLQGMDSVYVESDVELGGSDQKFNVLMGRDYQRNAGQRPQVAILNPILIGLDGHEKMSKSLDNFIAVMDDPFDKFGKVMSIPDDLMENYYTYATTLTPEECLEKVKLIKEEKIHPNEAKKQLAEDIVSIYHDSSVAKKMREQFESVFKKGQIPDDILEYEFKRGESLAEILCAAGVLSSNSEVRRLVKSGAIKVVDGDKVDDAYATVDDSFSQKVLKVGKRKFIKLV